MLSRRYRHRRSVSTCDSCGSDFVHPVTWAEQDESHWWMLLHCGAVSAFAAAIQHDLITADDFAR
jgi:hypothetical protein